MRHVIPVLAACILSLSPIALSTAKANPIADTSNADICASKDDDAFPPQRRISACSALIDTLKDQPAALAAALVDRGTVYWYINKLDPALTDFDRAIALDPKNAAAFRERANTYRTMDRLDKALADANEAVRLDPSNAEGFDYRANIFNNNAQYDRAMADYNEALRLKPDYAQALADRGAAYYFKKDYEDAIKDYNAAINVDPKNAWIYANRASAYHKLGRNDQAIADDTAAIKLDALTPEFFDNRGLSEADNGDYDRAIADYEQSLRINPQFDKAAENLAQARRERDHRVAANSDNLRPTFDCGKASRAVEKAICSDPDLSRLDREIDAAYRAALATRSGKPLTQLREEQRDFIAVRNKSFGRPQYNLRHEMESRLAALRGGSADLSR